MADDINSIEDNNQIEDTYGYDDINESENSEGIDNKVNAQDFDPERVLYDIQKALIGFEKRNGCYIRVSEPLARTEFITLYINSIRSLVNFHSMFSMVPSEEAAFNMLESLKEITYAAVDYGVKEEHLETFINIYDTIKNTFYGIIIDGRGTENVKQVLTSVYKDLNDHSRNENQKQGLVNWNEVNRVINGNKNV